MVRLKNSRSIEWAGVEFQPNLLKPVRPVRLGLVLFETQPRSTAIQVIGRTPVFDSRPDEFKDVSDITLKIAANWVDHISKDILEITHGDIFSALAQRWKWNLYIIKPKNLKATDIHGTLEKIAKDMYQRFVGEPFNEKVIKPSKAAHVSIPAEILPAWLLENVTRQKLGHLVR